MMIRSALPAIPTGPEVGADVLIGSLVVASNRSAALLDACLASLRAVQQHGVEIIVARPENLDPPIPALRRRYPFATFIEAPRASTIPHLRGIGLSRSRGGATAVTEDHCLATDGWLAAFESAIPGADVVGGSVGNARERPVDWAAYYSEYGLFSWTRPAAPEQSMPLLTGANVVYRDTVRDRVAAWASDGVWENVIHARLHAEGCALRFAPDARLLQNQEYGLLSFCRDRFQHGRAYAANRTVGAAPRRWAAAGAAPVLTVVLLARVARASASVNPGAFVRALPYTAAFLASWSLGEAAGYLAPDPRSGS